MENRAERSLIGRVLEKLARDVVVGARGIHEMRNDKRKTCDVSVGPFSLPEHAFHPSMLFQNRQANTHVLTSQISQYFC